MLIYRIQQLEQTNKEHLIYYIMYRTKCKPTFIILKMLSLFQTK